ncbi:GNAT family N-acetyltransferase [Streptomyces sp. NPDC056883]|uniref:GNAT family N-acetyltransferase n=1 Tax=Streptomyces sp. NPDC056883 TaxID=3345959 RepID=UPI0036C3B897
MTSTLTLQRYTELGAVKKTFLDLWAEVRAPLLHLPNYAVSTVSERLDRHATDEGFEVVIGYDGDEPVGYAYGNHAGPDDRYWARITPFPDDLSLRGSGFALKELGVRPAWRGTGAAKRIHDHLLAGREEKYVSLMVNPEAGDGKVQRIYESWNYTPIGTSQPSPDSPVLLAMVRNTS